MEMKKALVIGSLLLASCGGNSVESDAKKAADIYCKAQSIARKAQSGDASALEESSKLSIEAANLTKELQNKYSSPEDAQRFSAAYATAIGHCN